MSNFLFDLNKCVGCHACVVACQIENGLEALPYFREVYDFNYLKVPGIPIFHLSLACNHCTEASCVKNCPSTALTRDKQTGAVWVDHNKCIGCQYCVWSCPFDVPKFNHSLRMVEKCNWCKPRIEKQEKPNCVNLCPTGALAFEFKCETLDFINVAGFPTTELKPNIQFVDFRFKREKESETLSVVAKEFVTKELEKQMPNKISARKEWPLILFTLLFSLISGMKFSEFLGFNDLNSELFYSLITVAGISSLWHLGRKERAFRAITNLKTSWLSREIFSFGGFVGSSLLSTLFVYFVFDVFAVVFAIFTLFSIEKIYSVTSENKVKVHSANVILTALFFAFVIGNQLVFSVVLIVVKLGLYYYRMFLFGFQKHLMFMKIVRGGLLIIPILFVLVLKNELNETAIFAGFLVSEMMDRIEFYNEITFYTPKIDQFRKIKNFLN